MTAVDTIMKHYQSVNRIIADQQFKPSGGVIVFTAAAANISRTYVFPTSHHKSKLQQRIPSTSPKKVNP